MTSVLALALLCAAPRRVVLAEYAPQWLTGDWWVVRTLEQPKPGNTLRYNLRYEVRGIEKVDDRECFVLQTRVQSSKGNVTRTGSDFYVRKDDWRVVRQVTFGANREKLLPPDTLNYPDGLFGPFAGEPRIPRFPVRLIDRPIVLFRPEQKDDSALEVTELVNIADSGRVRRLLDVGDTIGKPALRPPGTLYEVRDELRRYRKPGILPDAQSLQFWSPGQPWRVYEELAQYDGAEPSPRVVSQSWLIAVGHTDK